MGGGGSHHTPECTVFRRNLISREIKKNEDEISLLDSEINTLYERLKCNIDVNKFNSLMKLYEDNLDKLDKIASIKDLWHPELKYPKLEFLGATWSFSVSIGRLCSSLEAFG